LKTNNELHQIAFSQLHGIGPSRASQIISEIGVIEDFFSMKIQEIYLQTGIAKSILQNLNREAALAVAEKQLRYNEKHQITTHFFLDTDYPRRLKQCADLPIVLYSKGNMNLNQKKIVSVVGTRNQTEYGHRILKEFIDSISESDILVVSGLAYGVDISAHRLCLENKIQTVAVLGHGLDRIYPAKHAQTAIEMLDSGGLLTEFGIGTNPDRENFPMRNRIVAGLADATIVIESKAKGGSIITAELANDYSRDVFAFPGDIDRPYSEGCNQLLRNQKAHLITNGYEFLKFMNWEEQTNLSKQKILFEDFTEEEKMILRILQHDSDLHMDVISMKVKLSASKMNVLLFHLEMKNAVVQIAGKRYRLSN
jgi:DNA processing protein